MHSTAAVFTLSCAYWVVLAALKASKHQGSHRLDSFFAAVKIVMTESMVLGATVRTVEWRLDDASAAVHKLTDFAPVGRTRKSLAAYNCLDKTYFWQVISFQIITIIIIIMMIIIIACNDNHSCRPQVFI